MNVDIQGCISGRKDAWDEFVKQTSGLIYAAVNRAARGSINAHSPKDVDDCVQDVYVRLIRNDCHLLRSFDPARASLSTWLTLVARSTVYECLQKKILATVPLDGQTPSRAAVSESDSILNHTPAIALNGLSERQRLVLKMLFDEGMSVEEAAGRLNVDPQTIRSTKHKALTRLREQYRDQPSPDSTAGGDVSPAKPIEQ